MTLSLFKLKQGLFRPFKHFRKNLPLDYKKGGKHDHKNPHAIPLKVKDRLLNVKIIEFSQKKEEIGKK